MNQKFPELATPSGMCRIDECEDDAVARGLCSKHYARWRVRGDTEDAGQPIGRHLEPWNGNCNGCGRKDVPFPRGPGRKCVRCVTTTRKAWRVANLDRSREIERTSALNGHRRRRVEVIRRYGGRCTCCGETEMAFLTIDHKYGGGNAHRRSLSKNGEMVGSTIFYRWLLKHGCPDGFQVLCHNCNFAKSHGGCPHERKRQESAA